MMMSKHRNPFDITGLLWGESIAYMWIPVTKGQLCGSIRYNGVSLLLTWISNWTNCRVSGGMSAIRLVWRHVSVMQNYMSWWPFPLLWVRRLYVATIGVWWIRLGCHVGRCGCQSVCKILSGKLLTHWGRDKMAAIFQTTFSNGFSWMKMYEFRLTFHWSLFPRVQLTIFQHWFR